MAIILLNCCMCIVITKHETKQSRSSHLHKVEAVLSSEPNPLHHGDLSLLRRHVGLVAHQNQGCSAKVQKRGGDGGGGGGGGGGVGQHR